jgi:tyrosine-protein kinase Etk/Wzc
MGRSFGRAPITMAEPVQAAPAAAPPGEVELRSLRRSLARNRRWIIAPALLSLVISFVAVHLLEPRYESESRILVEQPDSVLPRPNAEPAEERAVVQAERIASQIQLVLSRDLARDVITNNRLGELPEFDPVLRGVSPLQSLLALVGIGRDPFALTPEERVLDAYYDRLTVYPADRSRVIIVAFRSRDPELAARIADSVAEAYLVLRQQARQDLARSVSTWLAGEIERTRKKVSEAESRAEDFRSKSNRLSAASNATLSGQQIGELNAQLNNARAIKTDAESKTGLIRDILQSGKPIESSGVLNSELMRRLSARRIIIRGQLAEQSSTRLEKHPRIKELNAHLADLDRQIRDEAGNILRFVENDARIAGERVESASAALEQLKKRAGSVNSEDLQLRALEREAEAQRDLLKSYLKYREANTGETVDAPGEGRIVSRAMVSHAPAFPKKLPMVLLATLATLVLSTGVIAAGELLGVRRSMAVTAFVPPAASGPVASPIPEAVEPPAVDPQPMLHDFTEDGGEAAPEVSEIERIAQNLRASGEAARKITVLGTGSGDGITLTALTLARLMARDARVVLVELAESSATISAVSVDASAPGLAELMQGEASFAQMITRDQLSHVHLVNAGRRGFSRSLLQSPRLRLAIDAFQRVYDHVVLDAGTASDLPAELLTANALAVVVPDPSMANDARQRLCGHLAAAGFADLQMLEEPVNQMDAIDYAARLVAA